MFRAFFLYRVAFSSARFSVVSFFQNVTFDYAVKDYYNKTRYLFVRDGYEVQWGMLAVYENYKHIEDIEQRITMVYRKIEQMSLCQHFPIALIHTRDNSYTLLERG